METEISCVVYKNKEIFFVVYTRLLSWLLDDLLY